MLTENVNVKERDKRVPDPPITVVVLKTGISTSADDALSCGDNDKR